MTMVPARDVLPYGGYGGFYAGGGGVTAASSKLELSFDLDIMAEEESRTTSLNEAAGSSRQTQEENEGQEVDGDSTQDRWLQLGLGGGVSDSIQMRDHQSSRLVELDLFSPSQAAPSAEAEESGDRAGGSGVMGPPQMYFQSPLTNLTLPPPPPPLQEISWGGQRLGGWTSTASSSMMPFYSQAFHHQHLPRIGFGGPATFEAGGSSSGARFFVVDAPRRPQAGVWFVLQASQNQRKEPTFPQIPKSYLRIKDGRMTVRLLMKYLAKKLGVVNESEVEITCKGQRLSSLMTLQYVRDSIWSCSRDAITLLPDSATAAEHVMVLRYGRSSQTASE